jgi:hypothetical protein
MIFQSMSSLAFNVPVPVHTLAEKLLFHAFGRQSQIALIKLSSSLSKRHPFETAADMINRKMISSISSL